MWAMMQQLSDICRRVDERVALAAVVVAPVVASEAVWMVQGVVMLVSAFEAEGADDVGVTGKKKVPPRRAAHADRVADLEVICILKADQEGSCRLQRSQVVRVHRVAAHA